jgi:7,8-dihydropterin-6-yl-methyl-4-(beta-D-ribofuranosyl)aminobenzene 5'-phosphate synthase
VGLDHEPFEEHPDRFQFVDESAEVSPGIFVLTEIGQRFPQPRGNRRLFVKEGGSRSPDTFEHELVLAIREKGGLVVFTGCSHRGIVNMVDAVAQRFQGLPVKAVFGGFHLIGLPMLNTMAGSKKEVEDIARTLRRYDIGRIYTGHCTGPKGYRVLKGVLGEQLELLHTGSRLEV